MIFKRFLVVLGIILGGSLISGSLLLVGNTLQSDSNEVKIYSENEIIKNDIKEEILEESKVIAESIVADKQEDNSSIVESVEKAVEENDSILDKVENIEVIPTNSIPVNNEVNSVLEVELEPPKVTIQEINTQTEVITETKQVEEKQEEVVTPVITEVKEENTQEVNTNRDEVIERNKNDVYTFERNDSEIQNMINIAKRIIKENKNGRCDGLVNQVDSINFNIGKAGDVFYPLFDYRIENIVVDNFFPVFNVYAEDIYRNGEYLRTEYYFN